MSFHRCERFVSRRLPCPFQLIHDRFEEDEEPDRGSNEALVKEVPVPIQEDTRPARANRGAPVFAGHGLNTPAEAAFGLLIDANLAVGSFSGARKALSFQGRSVRGVPDLPGFPVGPIPPTIPQPPPVQASPPARPVRPSKTVKPRVPARNRVEQMMAIVEEDLAAKLEVVANANAPASTSLAVFQEEAFPNLGNVSFQLSVQQAMAAAMPSVMSFSNFLFRQPVSTSPPTPILTPTKVYSPPNSVRMIRSMVASGGLYSNRGGYGGLTSRSPSFRPGESIPVGGYRLSDDFSHLEVFQEEAFGP